MNGMDAFEVWAPASSIWSSWAKPVLFAHMDRVIFGEGDSGLELEINDVAEANGATALIADLPAEMGVVAGLRMAHRGFRPVPLYNACPAPAGAAAAVEVGTILERLARGTGELQRVPLANNGPPVFLLDSLRRGGRALGPGDFDNRSLSLPTDFPSVNFMRSRGVERVVLMRQARGPLPEDLAHTLRRWQEGGIQVFEWSMIERGAPQPVQVERPTWFGSIFQRALATIGFRRNMLGGFGGILPQPSGG